MRRERESLRDEAKAMLLDPAQAREHLLQKVKNTTAIIKRVEARLEQLSDENDAGRRTLQELTTDINERKGENNESHKYEVLFQRDKEMTGFIDNFQETKMKEKANQEKTKKMIVALLEHISRDINRKTNMPSRSHLKSMRDDLSFKKRQMDASESTHVQLKIELEKRQGELKKISGLDGRIEDELKVCAKNIKRMQKEIKIFEDMDGLGQQAEMTRRKLVSLAKSYKNRKSSVRQQVMLLSSKYEQLKEKLAVSETAKALDAQEQRLRHYEQNLFKLNEFIESKGRETDYVQVKDECKQQMGELNALLVSLASELKPVLISNNQGNLNDF